MPKDTTTSVYAALAKAQAAMSRAAKSESNPHFKSKYADLAAVQDACMKALHDNGFAVYQPTEQTESGWAVRTVLAHESGETLDCVVPLILGKNDMQGLGSAITYARRYGLLCMSGVAPEDDDGHAAVQNKRAEPQPQQRPAQPNPDITDPDPAAGAPQHDAETAHMTAIDGAMSEAGLESAGKAIAADKRLDAAAKHRLKARYGERLAEIRDTQRQNAKDFA